MYGKTLRTFYFLEFLFNFGFSFFFATYTLFLLDRGLDYFELNLVNVVCMAVGAGLEMPTGGLADSYGRKKVIVVSYFVYSLSFLIYFFGDRLLIFLVAESVAALGGALLSGAFDAWAVDELKHYRPDFNLQKVFADRYKLKNIAIIAGPVSGALIGSLDLALPWLFSSFFLFITGVLAIFLIKENSQPANSGTREKVSVKKVVRDSIRYGVKNRAIFFLTVAIAIFAFTAMPFNMLWQPIAADVFGLPTGYLGLVFTLFIIFIILGNVFAGRCPPKPGKEKPYLLFTLLSFSFFGLLAGQNFVLPAAALGYFLTDFTRGIFLPFSDAYLHSRIPDKQRATIQSFTKMASRAGGAIGMLACGYFANISTPQFSLLLISGISLILIFLLSKLKNGD